MTLEQTDFFNELDKPESVGNPDPEIKQEKVSIKEPKMIQKPNDGLDFNCEVCQDVEGGCPSCGFGRNR